MEKFGFLAVILVWGGLIYFLLGGGSISTGLNSSNFLASAFSGINGVSSNLKQQEGVIGIVDAQGNFQTAKIHSNSAVDIFDNEISQDNPQLIFAGSNRGLFISKDGGLNWYAFSDLEHKIIPDTQVYKIIFNKYKKTEGFISVFSGNKGIIYKSEDNFFSLDKLIDFDNEGVYDFDVSNNNLYLGLSNGRLLLYSLEKNETRVLTNLNSAIKQIKVFQNGGLIYLTLKSGGFWVSTDGGVSFEKMKFLDSYRGANNINDFVPSISDNSLIYAATNYGLIRSLNSGKSWQIFKSLPSEEQSVSVVGFNDKTNSIFTASNGKIYKSSDGGSNWQIMDTDFSNREFSILKLIGDKIIIGTKG